MSCCGVQQASLALMISQVLPHQIGPNGSVTAQKIIADCNDHPLIFMHTM